MSVPILIPIPEMTPQIARAYAGPPFKSL